MYVPPPRTAIRMEHSSYGTTQVLHLKYRAWDNPVLDLSYWMSEHNDFFEMFVSASVLHCPEMNMFHILDIHEVIFDYGSEAGNHLTTQDFHRPKNHKGSWRCNDLIYNHLVRILPMLFPKAHVCRYNKGNLLAMQSAAKKQGMDAPWTKFVWKKDAHWGQRYLAEVEACRRPDEREDMVDYGPFLRHFTKRIPGLEQMLDACDAVKSANIKVTCL